MLALFFLDTQTTTCFRIDSQSLPQIWIGSQGKINVWYEAIVCMWNLRSCFWFVEEKVWSERLRIVSRKCKYAHAVVDVNMLESNHLQTQMVSLAFKGFLFFGIFNSPFSPCNSNFHWNDLPDHKNSSTANVVMEIFEQLKLSWLVYQCIHACPKSWKYTVSQFQNVFGP